MKSLTPKHDILDEFINCMKTVFNKKSETQKDNSNNIKKRITETRIKIDKLIELYEKQLINEADFSIRYKKLKDYQEELKISDIDTEITLSTLDLYIDYSVRALRDLPDFWENSTIEVKNKFGSILFPEGIYYSDNNVGTTNLSAVLRVFSPQNYGKSSMVGDIGFEPMTSAM